MSKSIGIVGAGLMGRLLAYRLVGRGWQVTLFDKDAEAGTQGCTHVSAGMIAPSCELETAERCISAMGLRSLEEWPRILAKLDGAVYFERKGSLVVAHPSDELELQRLRRRIEAASPSPEFMKVVDREGIREVEPELAGRFASGLYLSREAHIDNRAAMDAMAAFLRCRGVSWRSSTSVDSLTAHTVRVSGRDERFDCIADCRGLGARDDLTSLRGVRGEIVQVHAPEVHLQRPVRLAHPRYPIYVVPRENQIYVIGATAIESEDLSPIAVRSALELLSAAYTVHTGFAEARLLETAVQCRPAFPDNHPRILHRPGLIRINGLYRHGWLLAPVLSDVAARFLDEGAIDPEARDLMQEER